MQMMQVLPLAWRGLLHSPKDDANSSNSSCHTNDAVRIGYVTDLEGDIAYFRLARML